MALVVGSGGCLPSSEVGIDVYPVLRISDFSQAFEIESDASGPGI